MWETGVMATRQEVHNLVDGVPEDQLNAVSEVMHAAVEAGLPSGAMHRLAELMRTQGDVLRLHIDPALVAQLVNLASMPGIAHLADVAEQLRMVLPVVPTQTAASQIRLAATPIRTFASAGALSAEHDLAERAEDVLRTEDDNAK
jgi:hypothetical protein